MLRDYHTMAQFYETDLMFMNEHFSFSNACILLHQHVPGPKRESHGA